MNIYGSTLYMEYEHLPQLFKNFFLYLLSKNDSSGAAMRSHTSGKAPYGSHRLTQSKHYYTNEICFKSTYLKYQPVLIEKKKNTFI